MYVRRISRKDGTIVVRVVESIRRGDKIEQKVLSTVGKAKNREDLLVLDRMAHEQMITLYNQRDPALPGFESLVHGENRTQKLNEDVVSVSDLREGKRLNVGVEDVLGEAYQQLDFGALIRGTRKDEQWNEILKDLVFSRILEPTSKRRASLEVLEEMDKQIPLEKIYRMMDRLVKDEEGIKRQIFQASLGLLEHEVGVIFFDVTTLYFESFEEDELRRFGFSKDCKFKETQVVLALVSNNRGMPLTYELFPGNQHEGGTLIEVIKRLKSTYQVKNVVMVADRAMFNEENLQFLESEKINYIVAAKLKGMKKEIQDQFLTGHYCPMDHTGWIKDIALGSRRLIVSYAHDRSKKDRKMRTRLIERLQKKARNGRITVSSLVKNHGSKKYIEVIQGTVSLNEKKIAQDSLWDGIHGVITNYTIDEQTPAGVLEKYKGLWKIEEVFRVNKNDLKMRPIYHFKASRIRAHILICFITYTLLNFTMYQLQKAGLKLSIHEFKRELEKREVSIIRDRYTQRKYMMPNSFSEIQKSIYKAFKIRITEGLVPLFGSI